VSGSGIHDDFILPRFRDRERPAALVIRATLNDRVLLVIKNADLGVPGRGVIVVVGF
jgi:hypothetical protein